MANLPRSRGDQPRQQVLPNGDGGDVKSGRAAFPPTHVKRRNFQRPIRGQRRRGRQAAKPQSLPRGRSKGAKPRRADLQRARLRRDAARGQVQPTPRIGRRASSPRNRNRERGQTAMSCRHTARVTALPNPKIRKWCAEQRVPSASPGGDPRANDKGRARQDPKTQRPRPEAKSKQAGVSRAVQRVRMSPPGGGGRH